MFKDYLKKRARKVLRKRFGDQVSMVVSHANGYIVDSIDGELQFFQESDIRKMLRNR